MFPALPNTMSEVVLERARLWGCSLEVCRLCTAEFQWVLFTWARTWTEPPGIVQCGSPAMLFCCLFTWMTVFTFNEVMLLFSCQIVSDSLPPHGLQHARPLCPFRTYEVTQYPQNSSLVMIGSMFKVLAWTQIEPLLSTLYLLRIFSVALFHGI